MQDTSLKENHFQPAFLTSGCSSITVVARIMGLALFERDCVHKSSKHCLWTFSFEAMGLRIRHLKIVHHKVVQTLAIKNFCWTSGWNWRNFAMNSTTCSQPRESLNNYLEIVFISMLYHVYHLYSNEVRSQNSMTSSDESIKPDDSKTLASTGFSLLSTSKHMSSCKENMCHYMQTCKTL